MEVKKDDFQKKFDKKFGEFIRKKRKKIGSIELFLCNSPELNISRYHYGAIERGERSVSLYKALDIINHLNNYIDEKITINDLLEIMSECKMGD